MFFVGDEVFSALLQLEFQVLDTERNTRMNSGITEMKPLSSEVLRR